MTSREPRWTRSSRARAAAAGLVLLLGVAIPATPPRAEKPTPALYQWTDDRGNVRYTPDPDRVPASQRETMQRLEPGAPATPRPPRASALPGQSPAPTALTPVAPTTPAAPPAPAAAPSSTPAASGVAPATARVGALSAPEPAPALSAGEAAREQQLAAAIAADEEALKSLISAPVAEGAEPPVDSEQLREIARRLPALQAELTALRERRAPPAGP
jgi:hypothetical protein